MSKEDIMRAIIDPNFRAELISTTGITEEELKQHMNKMVSGTHPPMGVI